MPTILVTPVDELNQQIFLTVLREVLPTLSRLDDGRLIKKIGVGRFKDSCDELFGYIETGLVGDLSKLEKNALASQIIRCLMSYMTERMRLSVTIKTLIDSFPLINAATDSAFPGYHQSKLLRYIIK